ncbi:putative RING finger protein [Leptomonas pyrrhocoris]|uniref:RBR-type E3 ubiquitin transferase n=1 Tax=Leptomonas pyrrhocoris TaxID=157538 RepID=A0A0N0VGG5_LEPPY|nr:putative RING finger protein [Leptomonas pyrrhocoris]KPA83261.1 putative RING finger protein [Leptomonas pyrrhocoris]|eukprot:XP_015661700.1 putative RING finger protein [Leptomonas pyrrhocoris]
MYDYDDDDYDDDDGYTYEDAVPDRKGEARTMAMKEVLEMQAAVVDEVARITCLSASAATLLLDDCFWSRDVALERYVENPEAVLRKLRLTPESASHENTLRSGPPGTRIVCEICALDYASDEVSCLSSCGHYFCKECWQDHIKAHVHSNLLATHCPALHCEEVVGIRCMMQLLDDGSDKATSVMTEVYREYLSRFVHASPSLYWCPNPVGCTGIIHVEVPPLQGQGVTCDVCHRAFCLRCASEPHRPATCDNMRRWRQYCTAEGLSMALILVKMKRCSKCHKDIEKNGGCNHMTCKCGHQFCWVCGHDWSSHTGDYYSCKNASAASSTDDSDGVRQSKRFLYHFERYTLHLDSAKRDATFIDTYAVDNTATITQQPSHNVGAVLPRPDCGINALEVMTLIKNTLMTARSVIAHAYVQMYYLDDKSREASMMAHRVGKLEETTEQLSGNMIDYLRLSKSNPGPLLDTVHMVDNWQKVICEA